MILSAAQGIYFDVRLLVYSVAHGITETWAAFEWTGLLYLLMSPMSIVAGIGILRRQQWARRLALLLAALTILNRLWLLKGVGGFSGVFRPGSWLWIPLAVVAWNVIVLFFLLRPAVKAQFVKSSTQH